MNRNLAGFAESTTLLGLESFHASCRWKTYRLPVNPIILSWTAHQSMTLIVFCRGAHLSVVICLSTTCLWHDTVGRKVLDCQQLHLPSLSRTLQDVSRSKGPLEILYLKHLHSLMIFFWFSTNSLQTILRGSVMASPWLMKSLEVEPESKCFVNIARRKHKCLTTKNVQ